MDWLYCQNETKREIILYKRGQRRLKKKFRAEAIKKMKNSKSTFTNLVTINGVVR